MISKDQTNIITDPFILCNLANLVDSYTFLNSNYKLNNKEKHDLLVPAITDLNKFKYIMHPIKLSLLKYLNINNFDTRANILKNLQIASGNFDYHFRVMEKKGLMVAVKEFIKGNSIIIIHIEPSGRLLFRKFNKAIMNFLKY